MNIRSYKGITPEIHPRVYVDATAVVIGDVVIGEDSSVWPMTVIRGDVEKIRIGARTNLQDGCILHVTHEGDYTPGGFPLTVGDDVTAGHRATLHACTIGSLCLIGMSATIMDGAILEDRVMVGAGSLVPPGKILESGHLYVGTPARKVRALTDGERELLAYSARHYVKLKDQYLNNGSGI